MAAAFPGPLPAPREGSQTLFVEELHPQSLLPHVGEQGWHTAPGCLAYAASPSLAGMALVP